MTTSQQRLAPVVFVSHLGAGSLPLDATSLRRRAVTLLEGALVSSGIGSCDRESVERQMRFHRIRGPHHLPGVFLVALADSCGADAALVVQHVLFARGMISLGRVTDPTSGRLRAVGKAERIFPPAMSLYDLDPDALADELDGLGRALLEDLDRPAGRPAEREGVAVLPARVEPRLWAQGQLTTYVVLEGLLAQDRLGVVDPGWLAAELRGRGVDPRRIDGVTRGRLAGDLGVAWLVTPRLISEEAGRTGGARRFEEEDGSDLNYEGFREPLLVTVHLSSVGTGLLREMHLRSMAEPAMRGAFGVLRRVSWIDRFESEVGGLVPDLSPATRLRGER
jgi:hypothetical protein